MKTQARLLSILLIFSLMLQTAFAEEQVVSSFKSYETENKFSIKPDAVVETHSTGKICDLIILGDGLTKLEDANSSSPVYILESLKLAYRGGKTNIINVGIHGFYEDLFQADPTLKQFLHL